MYLHHANLGGLDQEDDLSASGQQRNVTPSLVPADDMGTRSVKSTAPSKRNRGTHWRDGAIRDGVPGLRRVTSHS